MTNSENVKEFMLVMGQTVKASPELVSDETASLRLALIEEEFIELQIAITEDDLVGVADALTDLLYVVYGAAHAYGLDIDACFNEVHTSNMTKIQADGTVLKNAAGKVIKPPTYRPPNLESIVYANPSTLTAQDVILP